MNLVRARGRRASRERSSHERFALDIADRTTGRTSAATDALSAAELLSTVADECRDLPAATGRTAFAYLANEANTATLARDEHASPVAIRQRVSRARKRLRENPAIREWQVATRVGQRSSASDRGPSGIWWDEVLRIVNPREDADPTQPAGAGVADAHRATAVAVLAHAERGLHLLSLGQLHNAIATKRLERCQHVTD